MTWGRTDLKPQLRRTASATGNSSTMASDSSSTLVSSVSSGSSGSMGSSGISIGRVLLQQTPNTCDNKTGIREVFK